MYGKPIDSIGFVSQFDPEIGAMMGRELGRQQDGIELIASENFASPAVIAAMGSILTNKYAEGLPGKRYYGGCEFVDELEQVCIDRAKELFGAEFANVQPHSGASANLAVELAILNPGDTLMGMSLANGGHLSHGSPANISGKYYNVVSYDVNHETGYIDYDQIREAMLSIIQRDGRALADPAPYIRIDALADSAVVIEARAWVKNEDYWGLYDDVTEAFYKELPQHGANFPFPQLDVHLTKE